MSTDMIIKDRPDFLPALAQEAPITDEFLGGLGGGGLNLPVLSVRGKVFRLRRDGQEASLKTSTLDVILVGARNATSRRLYLDSYQSGEVKAPSCSSADGIKPDSNAQEPQADVCASCPRNQWVKTATGGMRKECDDYKRVLVFLPEQKIYSPVILDVSATSLRKKKGETGPELQMREYVQALTRNQFAPHQVVTTLGFTDDEYPRLQFSYSRNIRREEYQAVVECRESDEFEEALEHREAEGKIIEQVVEAPKPAPKAAAKPKPKPTPAPEPEVEEEVAPAPEPEVAEPEPQVAQEEDAEGDLDDILALLK